VKVKGSLSAPSVSVIPLKSAATKYGTFFISPFLYLGITAADFISGTLNVKTSKSPCIEYEKKHMQDQEKTSEEPK
jgi:hypothetical protein